MDCFKEAQRNSAALFDDKGIRSVFGVLRKLLDGIQAERLPESEKLKRWKYTCEKIIKVEDKKAEIQGSKVSDIQKVMGMLFYNMEQIGFSKFDEVIRYTEYCKWQAYYNGGKEKKEHKPLQTHKPTLKGDKLIASNSGGGNARKAKENIDFSDIPRWPLICLKLNDSDMNGEEKVAEAKRGKDYMINQKLWDKERLDKNAQQLREVIKNILNEN